MRHINLTPENKNGLAKYMVTQESNNFGDQILTLKKLTESECEYKIIAVTSRDEGDWLQLKDMKHWLANIQKIGVSQHEKF